MITLTEAAKQKFREFREKEGRLDAGLRITAQGGGCAGVAYGLGFASPDEVLEADEVQEVDGITVVADPMSYPHVVGVTVDFVETPAGAGFKVERRMPQTPSEPPKGPIAEKVQRVIDERINPGVASHGGFVSLVDIRDDTVFLRLGGGCQGCGMVDVTLKQGIEVLIKEEVPSIAHVYDVTDHAGGTNPYYQPSSK